MSVIITVLDRSNAVFWQAVKNNDINKHQTVFGALKKLSKPTQNEIEVRRIFAEDIRLEVESLPGWDPGNPPIQVQEAELYTVEIRDPFKGWTDEVNIKNVFNTREDAQEFLDKHKKNNLDNIKKIDGYRISRI